MKKFSILIDAIYISRGGGYILLVEFIKRLVEAKIKFGILLDSRLSSDMSLRPYVICLAHSNLIHREFLIHRHYREYDVILSFNNLPSIFELKIPYFLYFHNVLFFQPTKSIVFFIKKLVFVIISYRSRARWICQTKSSSNSLKLYLGQYRIYVHPEVFPFFPSFTLPLPLSSNGSKVARKNRLRFVYVSDGHPHKNHITLIRAFCALCDAGYDATLTLTVSSFYINILKIINDSVRLGYRIENYTHVKYSQMQIFLSNHDIAVYPSSFESFGLGLIEAAQCGLPIICSNRDFIFDVVKPFAVFDEGSVDSIFSSFEFCFQNDPIPSELNVADRMLDLIENMGDSCGV